MRTAIGFSILLAAIFTAYAQNPTASLNCATNPPDWGAMSYREADEASSKEANLICIGWKNICPEYITNLVSQLRDGRLDNDRKVLAVWLLGELWLFSKVQPSDTMSIEVLIEYVDLRATKFDPNMRVARWGDYPAQEALKYKVRKRAANPVLQKLAGETNDLRRYLMCDVLRSKLVLGQAAALDQLKHRIHAEPDPLKRANLQLALKQFEN